MSDTSRLNRIINRLHGKLAEDKLVQNATNQTRNQLGVDRVVLYYFYRQWEGRVTFESLSSIEYSILGSTGPDECFNLEYADLYLKGRVNAIADVTSAPIAKCHQDFLMNMRVQANLVAPILTPSSGLWGLFIAHHCQSPFNWSGEQIEIMKAGAEELAVAQAIQ